MARSRMTEREWSRKLDEFERQRRFDVEAKLQSFFMAEFGHDEDTATRLSMQVAPIVVAGRDGMSRSIRRNMRAA